MKTDFEKLLESKHMLEFLSPNPFEEILSSVTNMFIQQSSSVQLLQFKITGDPDWLSGAKPADHQNDVILVRTGFAVMCDFSLQDNDGVYDLKGIFTWVGANLDETPITKMWMDLDGHLNEFGKDGKLQQRIYELDA